MATGQVVDSQWPYLVVGHLCRLVIIIIIIIINLLLIRVQPTANLVSRSQPLFFLRTAPKAWACGLQEKRGRLRETTANPNQHYTVAGIE